MSVYSSRIVVDFHRAKAVFLFAQNGIQLKNIKLDLYTSKMFSVVNVGNNFFTVLHSLKSL